MFSDVQGLRPSDPVHFHGIPCGRVVSVEVVATGDSQAGAHVAFASDGSEPEPGVQVALALEIPSKLYSHLRTGSVVTIKKTLTGVTVVNLAQGSGDSLKPNTKIIGTQTATIDEVTVELHDAAKHLTKILSEVEPLICKIREDGLVSDVLKSVDNVSNEFKELATSLRQTIDENRSSISKMTKGASDFLDSGNQILPEIALFVKNAKQTAVDVTGLARGLDDWMLHNGEPLSDTAQNIASATSNLNTLSIELRRRPWRLLASPGEEEKKELSLYDNLTTLTESAMQLNRAVRNVKTLIERDNSPEVERQLNKTLGILEARLSNYEKFQEEFWRHLREIYK